MLKKLDRLWLRTSLHFSQGMYIFLLAWDFSAFHVHFAMALSSFDIELDSHLVVLRNDSNILLGFSRQLLAAVE